MIKICISVYIISLECLYKLFSLQVGWGSETLVIDQVSDHFGMVTYNYI